MNNKTNKDNVELNHQENSTILPLYVFLRALLNHWKGIAAFVVGITILAALLFSFGLPPVFEAEGYLQVIPIPSTLDAKNEFETSILSHLLKIQSAYTANEVSNYLKEKRDVYIDPIKLQKIVKIERPPKSNLIRITVKTSISPEVAKFIIAAWIDKYIAIAQKNNINTALFNIRNSIKQAQILVNNQQGKVNELKNQAAKVAPLITVTKSIDETQLWRILMDNPNKEKLKNIEEVKIKGEEESKEYIALKTMLYEAEQQLASAKNNLIVLQEVEKILQMRSGNDNVNASSSIQSFPSNAVEMAETMIKTSDIIPVGEAALLKSKRGALLYTALVSFISIIISFLVVYLKEFYRMADTYVAKNALIRPHI